MGCLKLTYYEKHSPLKIVHKRKNAGKNHVQSFLSIDPEAHNLNNWSPYCDNFDNPILYMDEAGDHPLVIPLARLAISLIAGGAATHYVATTPPPGSNGTGGYNRPWYEVAGAQVVAEAVAAAQASAQTWEKVRKVGERAPADGTSPGPTFKPPVGGPTKPPVIPVIGLPEVRTTSPNTNSDPKEKTQTKKTNSNYIVYITLRDHKVKMKMTDQPLVYIGITRQDNGILDRYSKNSIEYEFHEIVATGLSEAEARGIEQLLIELNNNGEAYPYFSNTVDNKRNSVSPTNDPIKYNLYKAAGEARLKGNWKVKYKWDRGTSRKKYEEKRGSVEHAYF